MSKEMEKTTQTEEELYIEINGELIPVVEGVEYIVPADEAEDMGAIESFDDDTDDRTE
ncbi:MAG: hypothetical protein PHO65_04325 [Sulfurovum sp.]|nr:hypothetical protein [Sulfurovum sp.]